MSPVIAANPIQSALWTYWNAKRGERSMPARHDIDPAEIPQLLPHLQLVERVEGRFRYRLTGTAIVEAYGRELTGKYLDEIIPSHRRAIAERHYTLVHDRRRPIFVRNKYTTTRSIDIMASRLILPLSADDATVTMLLMAQTFDYGSRLPTKLEAETNITAYSGDVEFL